MKNLLTAIFLVFSINAMSQTSFGVKGGLTLGKIIGQQADYEMAAGYTLGLLVNKPLKGHASFQAELNYTTKSYSRTFRFIDDFQQSMGSGTLTNRNSYIELPLLVKYSKLEGEVKPYFLLGTTISYLIGSRSELPSSSGGRYISVNYYKKGDMGATFGVGADIKAGPVTIILEARYNQGFIAMYKGVSNQSKGIPKIFNSYLSLTTGVRF